MLSATSLTLLAAAVLAGGAVVLVCIERRRARRTLAIALRAPQTVEKAWVSPPDESGLRCLFVKPVGAMRARTVAMDFEVDEVVRRFAQAGIRIGYEHEGSAA